MKTVSDSLGKNIWDKRENLGEVNGNAQRGPVDNHSRIKALAGSQGTQFLKHLFIYLVKFS